MRWVDRYYDQAQRHPFVALLHDQARRLRNRVRYGVDASHMFHAVELETNSMCNRRCGYCPNSFARRPSGFMDDALFDKIIGELGDLDYDGRISYHFYGEPLVDKRMPELVRRTRARVPRSKIEIYSNGDFLTLEKFRDYLARGLSSFLITQHDSEMTPALQRIVDEATPAERERITIRFVRDRTLINRSGLIEDLGKVREPLRVACDWPLTILVITLDGNVVVCCNDYFETEVVGNVRTQSLREVWTSPAFTRFRRALARGDRTVSPLCASCDHVPEPERLRRIVSPPALPRRRVALPVVAPGPR